MPTEIIFLSSVLEHNNHIEDLVNRHSAGPNYLLSPTQHHMR